MLSSLPTLPCVLSEVMMMVVLSQRTNTAHCTPSNYENISD